MKKEDHAFYSHVKVKDNVYRERNGVEYEDFEIGQVFQHRPGLTVTQDMNTQHTLMTYNQAMIHTDVRYAAKTEWERPLIVSTLTLSLVTGMSTKTFGRVVANLAWNNVNMTYPLYAGDTLYAESEVKEKRLSNSRKGQGILTIHTRGMNNNGTEVCSFDRTLLVYCRGHGPYEKAEY
ncbi:MAG: MaoC/PaaZ C-terminal domain-containing protein [Coxiellaceae bacterium]|nr:MaoC/PaaZ C-terminal domain-containing protein [Coxiellaceae bacterium]